MLPYFKAFISNSCYISFMFTQFALVLCTLWTLHTEISIGKRLNQKKFNHSFCYSNRILTMMSTGANTLKSSRSYLIVHILLIKKISIINCYIKMIIKA